MPEDRKCGVDAAAYALGALEPAETQIFRAHLASCAVCQDEVAAFMQVADTLPIAAPRFRAPCGLRRQVMRVVQAEARASQVQARRPPRSWLRGQGFRPRRGLSIVGAAVGTAAILIGGLELISGGSAASSTVIHASVIGSPGSARLRITDGRAELIVYHLRPPPAGRIYEVWLQRPDRSLSPTNALFSVTSTGAGEVDVPGNLHGVTEVLVTPEPDGGSLTPTHTPVIVARLT